MRPDFVGDKELKKEEPSRITDAERRRFLKMGLIVTGVLAGGSVLELVSGVGKILAAGAYDAVYPYKPHYAMVIRQDRCIGCLECAKACAAANRVPGYGWRTRVLEREERRAAGQTREFIPVLCNQCNNPPCVRTCPTRATYKDRRHGIVMMDDRKCIGCKSCMMACPYDARYFNEERRAIDKCDFCFASRLSAGARETACSEACPAGARVFGDLSDPGSRVYRLVHQLQKPVWVLKGETGAKPNVFYMKG